MFLEVEKIEGPVDIANGFAIKDAIMVESKDGLGNGGGDCHGQAVPVSGCDRTRAALDDLTHTVHLLLHDPIRVM